MSEYRDDLLKYWDCRCETLCIDDGKDLDRIDTIHHTEDQKLDHLTVPRLVDHTGRKGL